MTLIQPHLFFFIDTRRSDSPLLLLQAASLFASHWPSKSYYYVLSILHFFFFFTFVRVFSSERFAKAAALPLRVYIITHSLCLPPSQRQTAWVNWKLWSVCVGVNPRGMDACRLSHLRLTPETPSWSPASHRKGSACAAAGFTWECTICNAFFL